MEYRDLTPAEIADESLREIISSGIPGGTLPPERDLVDLVGVSRTTLRSSLERLSREGLVDTHSRGTKVNHKLQLHMLSMSSMTEELQERGKEVKVHVVSHGLVGGIKEALNFFNVSDNDSLFNLVRVRSVDGLPITFETTYLMAKQFQGIDELNFEGASLYDTLAEKFGVSPSYGREEIGAVMATESQAEVLRVIEGTPLFKVTSLTYDADDVAFEYSTKYLVGSRTGYVLDAKNIFDYQEDEE